MNCKQRRAQGKPSDSKSEASAIVIRGLFEAAVRHHQAGKLLEAQQLCRKVLATEPRHADSLHLLGVLICQSGRSEFGVDLLRQAIAINGQIPGYHSNLGIALMSLGRPDEAAASFRRGLHLKAVYPEAHYNLGNALRDQGKQDEAVACYRKALDLKPDYAEAECNLGVALMSLGKLDEAAASFRKALAITAAFPEVSYNLGVVLMNLGRPDEAAASFRQVVLLKPAYPEAHHNLGNALRDQGKLDQAVACYRKALDLKPDHAEAHCSLGTAFAYLGQYDRAEASYRRALEIDPTLAIALNNLAWTLNAQGQSDLALSTIRQSLRIGESPEAKAIFVDCVMRLADLPGDEDFQAIMVRALTEPWARPRELAPMAINMVKRNATPAADPLFCALLEAAPVCDVELERFLTQARRRLILDHLVGTPPSDVTAGADLRFYSALARQCFVNEYVFSTTEEEIRTATDLRDSMVAALAAGTAVPALWPLAIAMYFPLGSIAFASRLLERPWPAEVAAVLAQQVLEPAEELEIRATIPALTEIDDEVSLLVQGQYEANPYPRWEQVPPGIVQGSVGSALRKKFPLVGFKAAPLKTDVAGDHIDILIAGCGTGQQSIDVARTYERARVLAIDLSKTSLSYALRKTRQLGLSSIEYAQADLLKLGRSAGASTSSVVPVSCTTSPIRGRDGAPCCLSCATAGS